MDRRVAKPAALIEQALGQHKRETLTPEFHQAAHEQAAATAASLAAPVHAPSFGNPEGVISCIQPQVSLRAVVRKGGSPYARRNSIASVSRPDTRYRGR